jgi:tetratricopeptide (TPR) repeat protein/SAM-dependent methyltransferase
LRRRTARPPSDNRWLAQELVDRGIAAEKSGHATEALQYYRKALELDDRFARAHMNLGIGLQAAGEFTAAIASYERAIEVEPEYAAAHYNLALAQLSRSQYLEAEVSFRAALRFRADFPEAYVGLASALEALGCDEEALLALNEAIDLRGDYVGALLNSIPLLQKMSRHESAVANCRRALELEPDNPTTQYRLGISLHDLGRLFEAEESYRRALTLRPDYLAAKVNLAGILRATGRTLEAIPLLFELVGNEPTNTQLRRTLSEALNGVAVSEVGQRDRNILLSLCRDDNALFLVPTIVTLVRNSKCFQALQESARRGEDPFSHSVPAVEEFLRDALLLEALPCIPVSDGALEEVLTNMRRWILLRFRAVSTSNAAETEVPAQFICALARQCFFSGYAFFADEHELQRVTSLRNALQQMLCDAKVNPRTLESPLAIASLYEPLHTLKGHERLLKHPIAEWSEWFQPMVQEQLENRERERRIAIQLSTITAIDDEVSLAVREQYEENPYPRWARAPNPSARPVESLWSRLRPGQQIRVHPSPVPILIAGCGTGYHPILVARAYPDSEVFAVDLSRTSLAYAARMTEQLGIANITYRQADILKLGSLDRRFAVVECCGVLHHLDDVMAGWRVLVDLLESDGLMKIALYSEKARRAVRAAREFTRDANYPLTPDIIRNCRHAIMQLPDGHPAKDVMSFSDFYTLDGCRDLVMHVQEHQFTLPRIARCLDQLGLQFLEMECPATTLTRFTEMFSNEGASTNLDAWNQFEEIYPETFKSMYLFWCCKI